MKTLRIDTLSPRTVRIRYMAFLEAPSDPAGMGKALEGVIEDLRRRVDDLRGEGGEACYKSAHEA